MLSTASSVSELARMTGLAIDRTWICATAATRDTRVAVWCAPAWRAEDLLDAAPSGLPAANAVRVECRTGEAFWNAEWPVSFDLHWLREITPGFPLGVRPVRVQPEYGVQSTVRLRGDFVSIVWQDSSGRTRVQVTRGSEEHWAVEVEAGAESPSGVPEAMDEVLRALTGSTSVEWLRGVFADSCSLRWKELAERIGARPDQLDDLAMYFRGMTTTEEDALWRTVSSAESLSQLKPWLNLLASEPAGVFRECLREELGRQGTAFWSGAAGEWLNAVAGCTRGDLASPEAAARLTGTARKVLALLIRDDLARLLVRLRGEAEREWDSLAPWYRRRIEESCGALSARQEMTVPARAELASRDPVAHALACSAGTPAGIFRTSTRVSTRHAKACATRSGARSSDGRSRNVIEEVSLWMRKLHQRLRRYSEDAVRQSAQAALSAALDAKAAGSAGSRALAEFTVDPTSHGDLAAKRVLAGDWGPGFERASGAKLFDGQISHTLGRRIGVEVLLPFLSRKSWKLDRESLAKAEFRQSGNAQLALLRKDEAESRTTASLLLSAVYASRSEMPADDTIHMVHEDRRSLRGDECDAFWLRLVGAYGLHPPQLPASSADAPCEAALRIQIPWRWAEAWCHAPLKRDAGYLDKFLQLSLAMQEMTRYWLPALYLSSPVRFDSPNAVLPLLVYAASRPYADRKRAEFGYSAMSPSMIQRAASSASQRLPEILAPLHRSLLASGRLKTAELYSPHRAKLIVSAVQRQPRALATLLAGDAFLLEHCFQIAGMCRELRAVAGRNPARALGKISQFSEDIAKACHKGMKKFYANLAYRDLGTIYLLEATRVLAGGSVRTGLRASLTIETSAGIRRYQDAA